MVTGSKGGEREGDLQGTTDVQPQCGVEDAGRVTAIVLDE